MSEPAFYNNLELTLEKAGALWREGASRRQSPLHTPAIASIANGLPQQRVMVLRDVDWTNRTLRFHTDRRSTKCIEFEGHSAVSVLGYHPEEKVQMRLNGFAEIVSGGPLFEEAWATSTLFARRCYMTMAAPGSVAGEPISGLPEFIEGRLPTEPDIAPAKENFALVLVTFNALDWLFLANSGHRRAQFAFDKVNGWQGQWCIP